MKEYIYAKKISFEQGVVNADNLLIKKELQIGLSETKTTVFKTNGAVILDFGKEICGGVRILTFRGKNIPARIRFGESLSECCSDIGGDKNATNDHSVRDFTVYLQDYSDMTFGQTGFRFVRLDLYGEAIVKSVLAESYVLKKPVKYQYSGDDSLIRQIY